MAVQPEFPNSIGFWRRNEIAALRMMFEAEGGWPYPDPEAQARHIACVERYQALTALENRVIDRAQQMGIVPK